MAKPTILFIIDGLQVGGAERSLLMLCHHMEAFNPVVITLSENIPLLPEFEKFGIQVVVHPIPRNYSFRNHAKALKPTIDLLNPAIIHSSLFHADIILRYLDTPARKVTSLVSTMYSQGRLKQLPWLIRQKIKVLQIWDQWTAKKIDLFLANSQSIRDLYCTQLGYPSDKIKVIYRGRTFTYFYPKVPNKNTSFLYVGRLIPSKGVAEAIHAFSKFVKNHPKFSFTIAGDGPEKSALIKLTKDLGIEEKVVFFGQVDSVPELLSQADYFVFPSHYEGLPGSIIEAMFAKLPIICSDISENKECLKEGMCLFHKVGDKEDLLAQMEKALILDDWESRTQITYDYALTHFEMSKMVHQYEAVYQKLLSDSL